MKRLARFARRASLAILLAACTASAPPESASMQPVSVPLVPARVAASRPEPAASPEATPAPTGAIEIPEKVSEALVDRRRVASGLWNPRGMTLVDGGLLVALAGKGDPSNPNTGSLVRLDDTNGDGDFLDKGELRQLLGHQPSKSILEIVRRDEVTGMAAVAAGGGQLLATLAFFGGPSTIFAVEGAQVRALGNIAGNLNDMVYDATEQAWFAVSSSSQEVLRVDVTNGRGDRITKLPGRGQDSVPGYLDVDLTTGKLLVSWFFGSTTAGDASGEGKHRLRAGRIVSVDPASGETTPVVTGLTIPTDLLVSIDTIYVLEFCDGFLEPVASRAGLRGEPRHGGFRRYSGRLLRIDRKSRAVTVVAKGLDAPTNLTGSGSTMYIAQGAGTPGRVVPGPSGAVPIDGFIEVAELH